MVASVGWNSEDRVGLISPCICLDVAGGWGWGLPSSDFPLRILSSEAGVRPEQELCSRVLRAPPDSTVLGEDPVSVDRGVAVPHCVVQGLQPWGTPLGWQECLCPWDQVQWPRWEKGRRPLRYEAVMLDWLRA